MVACAPVTRRPRVQSLLGRGGLWRFSSRPSKVETVYFSWLAWPCVWVVKLARWLAYWASALWYSHSELLTTVIKTCQVGLWSLLDNRHFLRALRLHCTCRGLDKYIVLACDIIKLNHLHAMRIFVLCKGEWLSPCLTVAPIPSTAVV